MYLLPYLTLLLMMHPSHLYQPCRLEMLYFSLVQ